MGVVFSAFTLAYALFEVPGGWLADRFGARLMLGRIVLWWWAMTAATGLAGGFASLVALRWLFGDGRGRRAAEPGARLRVLAAGPRARARLRTHDHGGRGGRGAHPAARGGDARALHVAAGVPDLRSGRRRLHRGVAVVVPRRPAPAPRREPRRAGADRKRSAGAAPAGSLAPLLAQPQPARSVRDVLRRDLRLVLLPDLAADAPPARARLRAGGGRLAGGASHARHRDRIAGGRRPLRRAQPTLRGARGPARTGAVRPAAGGARDRGRRLGRRRRYRRRLLRGGGAARRARRRAGVVGVPRDRRPPRRRGVGRDEHLRKPRGRREPAGRRLVPRETWNDWNLPLYTMAALYAFAAACWLLVDPDAPLERQPATASGPC